MNGAARKLLAAIHIAVSVGVLGTDVVLIALGLAGFSMAPQAVYPAAHVIGQRVLWPLALAALGTGVTLALVGPYGVFRWWWVTIKLGITLALTGLLVFLLLPALTAAAAAASAGESLSPSRQLLLTIGPVASSSLLLTNIGLAVFKPKWRIARRMRRTEVTA